MSGRKLGPVGKTLLSRAARLIPHPIERWRERRKRKAFANLLIGRLSKSEALSPVVYDAEAFSLRLGNDQNVNLGYFWPEYVSRTPKQRERQIETIVQGLFQGQFELPDEYADASVDLLPKVWVRAALDRLDMEAEAKGTPVSRPTVTPLGSHLLVGVVYDLPHSMKTVRREDFRTWEVTFYEAMEQAVENLRSLPMQVGKVAPSEEYEGGLYIAMIGDSYDATRLLLVPDLVEANQLPLRGTPVAMMPSRDALLVTGDEDEAGLIAMADVATKMIDNEPRLLAPMLLRYIDGEWIDWHVDRSHPAAEPLHQLELRFLAEAYDAQRESLAEREATEDQPCEVAELLTFRHRETNRWTSVTMWGRHVRSLLPKADYIALVSEVGSEPIYVPWDDVEVLAGELMDPLGLSPQRWRVTEFPHPKAIEILAETATNPMRDDDPLTAK